MMVFLSWILAGVIGWFLVRFAFIAFEYGHETHKYRDFATFGERFCAVTVSDLLFVGPAMLGGPIILVIGTVLGTVAGTVFIVTSFGKENDVVFNLCFWKQKKND